MSETRERDTRIKPVRRRIVFEIDDFTNVKFSHIDEELMAENFEELLRKQYDVKVDLIQIEDVR